MSLFYPMNHSTFMEWLDEAKYYLPRKMSIDEARLLYERKLKDEEEVKNEASKKNS